MNRRAHVDAYLRSHQGPGMRRGTSVALKLLLWVWVLCILATALYVTHEHGSAQGLKECQQPPTKLSYETPRRNLRRWIKYEVAKMEGVMK